MDSSLARRGKQQASSFKLDKYQAPGYNGRQKEKVI
jgi:hypothetical protein